MPVTEDTKPNNLGNSANYKEIYSSLKSKLRAILYENELFQDELQKLKHELLDIYRDKESILEILIQSEDIDSSSSDSESQQSDIASSDTRNLIHPKQALQFSENNTIVAVEQSLTKTTATKSKPRSRSKAPTNATTVKSNTTTTKTNAAATKTIVTASKPNVASTKSNATVAKISDVNSKPDAALLEPSATTIKPIAPTLKQSAKPKAVNTKTNATNSKPAATKSSAATKNGSRTTQAKPARNQKQAPKKQPNKRQAVAVTQITPQQAVANSMNSVQPVIHMDTTVGNHQIQPNMNSIVAQTNQNNTNNFQTIQAPNHIHDQIPHNYQTPIVVTTTQNNHFIGQQHCYTIMASNDSGAYMHPQQLHLTQPQTQLPLQQQQQQQPQQQPQQPVQMYQPMTINQVPYSMDLMNLRQQQNDHQLTTEQLSAEELERHLESRRMEQAALLLPDWESGATNEIFSTCSAIKFMAED